MVGNAPAHRIAVLWPWRSRWVSCIRTEETRQADPLAALSHVGDVIAPGVRGHVLDPADRYRYGVLRPAEETGQAGIEG